MVKVAVTGGIGSGKSYVCRLIESRGIKVYDCDSAAKRIMASSDEIKAQLCDVVGDKVLSGGRINKTVLASYLLKSEKMHKVLTESSILLSLKTLSVQDVCGWNVPYCFQAVLTGLWIRLYVLRHRLKYVLTE